MTLIKSISGIRGTIGGALGENLTPIDIAKFATAYAIFIKRGVAACDSGVSVSGGSASAASGACGGSASAASDHGGGSSAACGTAVGNGGSASTASTASKPLVLVGKDGRLSGKQVENVVVGTLIAMGVDVINLSYTTTPSIELAIPYHKAAGGIMLTASHNPKNWNALKLLNSKGEFLSNAEGQEIIEISSNLENYQDIYAQIDFIGEETQDQNSIDRHIDSVLNLKEVDAAAIKAAGLRIVVDGINSTGAIAIPKLLQKLGIEKIECINSEVNGNFVHDPEPLQKNLEGLSCKVKELGADMGIAVDPDVDRLAFMNQDGSMFGEEYTLVAVADYLLGLCGGRSANGVSNGCGVPNVDAGGNQGCGSTQNLSTVSNLSSTTALKDISEAVGAKYYSAAVGEVNVVEKMKEIGAFIGGEGNGGVIFPKLHYGRDALVGVALFLSHFVKCKNGDSAYTMSNFRARFPNYEMVKRKLSFSPNKDVKQILSALEKQYGSNLDSNIDGVKLRFETKKAWVQLRASNTEPILRLYAEAPTMQEAEILANEIENYLESIS